MTGSITVRELDDLDEEVVVVMTEGGTVICGGTKGGPDVERACEGLIRTFLENGATAPVFLFVDQVTATVRQVKCVTGIRP